MKYADRKSLNLKLLKFHSILAPLGTKRTRQMFPVIPWPLRPLFEDLWSLFHDNVFDFSPKLLKSSVRISYSIMDILEFSGMVEIWVFQLQGQEACNPDSKLTIIIWTFLKVLWIPDD